MASTTAVRDVMSANVVTLRPDQGVAEAADVLAADKIGAAPVVGAGGALVGLLRDEDLILSEANVHVPTAISFLGADFVLPSALNRFEGELKKAAGAVVGDVMTTDFVTISPDESLETLATLMHDRDITHVPVVEGGALVGIVARGDLVRHLAAST
ncbi:MAG: CBS domain-containing protein [Acidimicrobiia bacterium]